MIIHWKINGETVSADERVFEHVQALENQVYLLGIRIIGLKQGYKRPASISRTSVDISVP